MVAMASTLTPRQTRVGTRLTGIVGLRPGRVVLPTPGVERVHMGTQFKFEHTYRAPSVAALLNGRPAREASPLFHLVDGMPPTLIVHGVDDEIVPIDQSRRACTALREIGNDCTLVELPGQRHAPEDPKQVARAFEAVREALAAL